jgi:CMP/dCMP kinase
VRSYLLEIQRAMGEDKKVVVEGRDMGTVVFPQADVKFFLDAALPMRARRRYAELKAQKGDSIRLQDVEADMRLRDQNDSTRCLAPLKPATDAIRIDSSQLTIAQVVEVMLDHIRRKS